MDQTCCYSGHVALKVVKVVVFVVVTILIFVNNALYSSLVFSTLNLPYLMQTYIYKIYLAPL